MNSNTIDGKAFKNGFKIIYFTDIQISFAALLRQNMKRGSTCQELLL